MFSTHRDPDGYLDRRREPAGGFAGPVDPEAPVGAYAGSPRLRRQALGGFTGTPDRQRQGSFGDAGRATVHPGRIRIHPRG